MVKLYCSFLLGKMFILCWGLRIRPHPRRFGKIAGIALFFFTDMKKEKNKFEKNIFFFFCAIYTKVGVYYGRFLYKMTKKILRWQIKILKSFLISDYDIKKSRVISYPTNFITTSISGVFLFSF